MKASVDDVVKRFPEALRRMQEHHEPTPLTEDGEPVAVLVPPEQWAALLARDFKAELLARLEENDEGMPHEEFMAELRAEFGPLDV